jgi:DNA-binding HxlR family transcriptional regulator
MAKKRFNNCIAGCPVEATLTIIGGKWKGVILYHLFQKKKLRFGELKKLVGVITQRMLTNQLRELEKDGIINRKIYAEVPPKVEYSFTKKGESLKTIINALEKWGELQNTED